MPTSPTPETETPAHPGGVDPDENLDDLLDDLDQAPSLDLDAERTERAADLPAFEPLGEDLAHTLADDLGISDDTSASARVSYRRSALGETIVTSIVALLVLTLIYSLLSHDRNVLVTSIALAGLATVAFVTIRSTISPDRLRSEQTKQTLALARNTLVYMRGGLSPENCQAVCDLLLPQTLAMAVAMTDDKNVLGYAGKHAEHFPVGSPIHTAATRRVLASQQTEVFTTPAEISRAFFGLPAVVESALRTPNKQKGLFGRRVLSRSTSQTDNLIPAGIVAPLIVRGKSVGTLKLYYDVPQLIDKTQRAIAEGLAEILSTQLAMYELDHQVELTTKAELRALQSQINPHFLFNTINTIASLIRTDPSNARELLREFAVFYRQTLENSQALIPFGRELEQTRRYLRFEVARFGDERIAVEMDIEPDLDELLRVPSFIIQPIVENSVNHAMHAEGTLRIRIEAVSEANNVTIRVSDDGMGMTDDQAANLLRDAGPTEKGTGIALKNVDARLKACFGAGSGVSVASRVGEGTVVTLLLIDALEDDE